METLIHKKIPDQIHYSTLFCIDNVSSVFTCQNIAVIQHEIKPKCRMLDTESLQLCSCRGRRLGTDTGMNEDRIFKMVDKDTLVDKTSYKHYQPFRCKSQRFFYIIYKALYSDKKRNNEWEKLPRAPDISDH